MDYETRLATVARKDRGELRHETWPYGRSVLGTQLVACGPGNGPVEVLLIAAMHGDECDTTVVLSEALRRLPASSLANPVVLSVNPDGALRGTRCNARGVDLNRNLPTANWSPGTVLYRGHGQEKQEIELSPGQSAASEPETRALIELVGRLQPATIVSLHAPLACIEDPEKRPLARWISEQVRLPLVRDVGYATPGSFGTWCAEQGIGIVTWELPAEPLPDLIASHTPVLRALAAGAYPPGLV